MNASAHLVTLFDVGSHAPHGSSLSLVTCHPCTCASLLEFTSLFFYFDLSFPVFFFSFHLLHFELHTELDNLIAMQNLRNSANKGSDDAYDVHKDRQFLRNVAQESIITNSKQLKPKKSAEFYEKNYGDSKLDFREAHQRSLTEMEELRILHSRRSQDESSSRTRTLFWNYQAEYKNYKMK